MPTTVHIPERLLTALDRRARSLRVSRNHLIVRAVERALDEAGAAWPDGFFERLRAVEPGQRPAVEDMLNQIRRARRSKPPMSL